MEWGSDSKQIFFQEPRNPFLRIFLYNFLNWSSSNSDITDFLSEEKKVCNRMKIDSKSDTRVYKVMFLGLGLE